MKARPHLPAARRLRTEGEVSPGVYRFGEVSERALFVLDPQGIFAWNRSRRPEVNGADGISSALDELSVDRAS